MTIVDKYAASWRQEIKSQKGSGLRRFRPSSDWRIEEFKGTVIERMKVTCQQRVFVSQFFLKHLCKSILRKQPTFGDATTGFPAERRNSILMISHYPDLGSASDWLNQISNAARPIRSTTQIWVVTRHQYGISALVSQMSFGGETSSGVAKCRLFSQATAKGASFVFVINIGVTYNDPNNCWEEGYHPNPP